MTPAQQAKEFAAANNIVIRPVGRRYALFGPNGEHISEVGGYPAALNSMRDWVETQNIKECTGPAPTLQIERTEPVTYTDTRAVHCDVVRDDGAMGVDADALVGNWQTKTPREIAADMVEGAKMIGATHEQAVKFCKHITPEIAHPLFDDFDAAAKARVRHAAKRIAKQRRRAAHRPPGGAWHVMFNGSTVMKYGYPTRGDAVNVVRWGFNHSEPVIRNNWRKATVTVEYRPS